MGEGDNMSMRPLPNQTVVGKSVYVNGKEYNGFCSIVFDDNCKASIEITFNSRREYLDFKELQEFYMIVKVSEKQYFHIYNTYITSWESVDGFGTAEPISLKVKAISFDVISASVGTEILEANRVRFKVTDGYELLGYPVYDVAPTHSAVFEKNSIDVPNKTREEKVHTILGTFNFFVYSDISFRKKGLNAEFEYLIELETTEKIPILNIRGVLFKFIRFLELLCGEHITINNMSILANDEEFPYIHYMDKQKDQLRLFSANGFDKPSFLRRTLFKLSDFANLANSLNWWFENYDKLILSLEVYERILYGNDEGQFLADEFLMSVQMIEGYTNAFNDLKENKRIFDEQKNALLQKLDDKDRVFAEKHLQFSSQAFRKSVKDFIYDGVNTLSPISKSKFFETYDDLISAIVNDRDYYTHLSSISSRKIDDVQLSRLTKIIVSIYRINLLRKLSVAAELIEYRFFFNRIINALLEKTFGIKLKMKPENCSDFDKTMTIFS